MSKKIPSYRHHKASGQAVVTLNGRDIYLGKFGTRASKSEYDRITGEWLSGGRQATADSDLSIAELCAAFLRFATEHYRKNEAATSEAGNVKNALQPLINTYGDAPARSFGPLALQAIRQKFIAADLSRRTVNDQTRRIVRMFRWAAANQMVPAEIHTALTKVAGLSKGRSLARETAPIGPVAEAYVEAIQPHVSRQIWAMIELQRLTGMRPGEACQMRTCDLDTSGKIWVYTPASHKTEHHHRGRKIYLGPLAQAVLAPWLRTELEAYLFQPREVMDEFNAVRRAAAKSKRNRPQRPRKPGHRPGERYVTCAYRAAISFACDKAGIPRWAPNRLRHNAATRLRKQFGLDVARVILGHSSPTTTEVYAEIDQQKAMEIMGKIG
jgi:integrase